MIIFILRGSLSGSVPLQSTVSWDVAVGTVVEAKTAVGPGKVQNPPGQASVENIWSSLAVFIYRNQGFYLAINFRFRSGFQLKL